VGNWAKVGVLTILPLNGLNGRGMFSRYHFDLPLKKIVLISFPFYPSFFHLSPSAAVAGRCEQALFAGKKQK
jgi:hypothetical protein